MADAHSDMLDLAVRLAEQQAAGRPLSVDAIRLADIMWLGTQVSANGFDGWLFNSSCGRIRHTLAALDECGCHDVAAVAREALAITGLDPARTDAEREARLTGLSEQQREQLISLDGAFHPAFEAAMPVCHAYARRIGLLPP